jgi:NhaC family Na+:H+ antiporter
MARPDTPQPLTLFEAVLPVVGLILLVGLSYYLFGDAGALGPNQVALAVATMIAVFIASSPLSDSANLAAAAAPPPRFTNERRRIE